MDVELLGRERGRDGGGGWGGGGDTGRTGSASGAPCHALTPGLVLSLPPHLGVGGGDTSIWNPEHNSQEWGLLSPSDR